MKTFVFESTKNSSTYYYSLISLNYVTLNDAMIYGEPNKTTYVETRMDYAAIREYGYTGNNINPEEKTAFLSVFI